MSAFTLRKLQQAREKLQRGDVGAAAALCEDALARAPRNPEALWLLGTIRLMAGAPDAAAALLERALEALPGHGASLENLGVAYLMLGRYPEAEGVLREALAASGAPPSARMRLGIALLRQGRHGAAIAQLERAAAADSANADARLNLGQAYAGAGDLAAAAQQFEIALGHDPDNADALYNLGLVWLERSDSGRARSCFERILARTPSYLDARERLAKMHLEVGRYAEAIPHLREIVRAQPANAELLCALATALFQLGALDEAQALADRARSLDPAQSSPYSVLAQIHQVRNDFDRAAAVLEEGYEKTRASILLGTLVYLLHRMCDWPKWQDAWVRMAADIDSSANLGSPFGLLNEATSPGQQLSYTRRWAAARFGTPAPSPPALPVRVTPRRLRVGYFSADFKEHAAAYLIAEVLELHDRERFEIYAYSYGPDDGSPMRARLQSAVEHFIDVAWDPDDLITKRMRDDDLDLLIELKGYTIGHRLSVLAQRPCRVQVTWLGYPGTTGADFIDYLIADPYIVPAGAEKHYSERVARLPHCYQPNDRKRPLAEPRARADYGLPQEAFVFCCFNQAVKIIPEVFARWMNLLRRVPGSVLWLAEDNRWATANLKQAALDEGIAAERVIFTPRMPYAQHLARYRVADLALDTFPYTAHTMASDGLWMGCPLIALCGESFTSRVSGSLLSNCELPDLVTHTLDEYEALAHRLATDAAALREVRERLALARDRAPLFDSAAFARDLEQVYLQITGGRG